MDRFKIFGNKQLKGTVNISGAKNSALPILFSTLLTKETVEIQNIPNIKDIEVTIKLLTKLGVKIKKNTSIHINASNVNNYDTQSLSKSIRASIWVVAPLLVRLGKVQTFLPGGCKIGSRPIDMHIKGLRKLGATIISENGFVKASVNGHLHGSTIFMEKISVGATLTVMIAAILAIGTTIIENAAREPEVVDTANFLITIGAKIDGAGTNRIIIYGVKKLKGGTYRILPDRIETGTFLVAAAISRGKILCNSAQPNTLNATLNKLYEAGADINVGNDWVSLNMHGKRPKAVEVSTSPYPGFPTDMQALFSLLNLVSEGEGKITENIFENRFMHIPELIRMGACAKIKNNTVFCYGVNMLYGSQVIATDLRSSVSLVLAGCIAKGITIVKHIYHIDRGYDRIEEKLRLIGANIERIIDK